MWPRRPASLIANSAAAMCGDGRVRTSSAGRGWRTVLTDSGGLTLSADSRRFVLVRAEPGCDGLLVQQFDARESELNDHRAACRRTSLDRQSRIGVAIGPGARWLWLGRGTEVF